MKRPIIAGVRLSEFERDILHALARREKVRLSEYVRGLIRDAAHANGLLPVEQTMEAQGERKM